MQARFSVVKRIFLFVGLTALFVLIALAATAIWIPHQFLGNEAFRQEMNRQTQHTLNVQGEWMPFRLDGWTLHSDGFEGSGFFSGYEYRLRAEHVSFEINWRTLLRRKWRIDPVQVRKLDLQIMERSEPPPPATPPSPAATSSFPRLAALFIPQSVDIQQLVLSDASVTWRHLDQKIYRISELQSTSIPDGNGSWSTSLTRGVFTPPGRLPWSLNSARLAGDLQQMDLHHAEWLGQEAGVIRLSGPLLRDGRIHAELKIEGRGIPANAVTPVAWRNFIQGDLDSDASARIDSNGLSIRGEAKGKNIQLVGVPLLRSMSTATGLRQWTELPLQTVWITFEYQDRHLHLPSSVIESKDMLRLEGSLRVQERQLTGTYQVGLAPQVVSKIPGARLTVFTLQQNGYHWAQPPMTLSGTADDPKEDLSPRLKSAILDAVEETIQQGVERGMDILDSILQRVP